MPTGHNWRQSWAAALCPVLITHPRHKLEIFLNVTLKTRHNFESTQLARRVCWLVTLLVGSRDVHSCHSLHAKLASCLWLHIYHADMRAVSVFTLLCEKRQCTVIPLLFHCYKYCESTNCAGTKLKSNSWSIVCHSPLCNQKPIVYLLGMLHIWFSFISYEIRLCRDLSLQRSWRGRVVHASQTQRRGSALTSAWTRGEKHASHTL